MNYAPACVLSIGYDPNVQQSNGKFNAPLFKGQTYRCAEVVEQIHPEMCANKIEATP